MFPDTETPVAITYRPEQQDNWTNSGGVPGYGPAAAPLSCAPSKVSSLLTAVLFPKCIAIKEKNV